MNNAMTSAAVKAAYAAAGLKVRVRDCGKTLRICPVGEAEFPKDRVAEVANGLGFTSVLGLPIVAYSFNGSRELFAYKPGAIVRC